MTFYDKFEALCTEIGKKPREIAKEAGVKTSTLSMWKTKGVTPKYGTIKQIATILHVEWTELVPEEQQEKVIIDQVLQAWQPKTTHPNSNPLKAELEKDFMELPERIKNSIERTGASDFSKAYDAITDALDNIDTPENRLLFAFYSLNNEGQQKAIERVEELTEIPKYQKTPENE